MSEASNSVRNRNKSLPFWKSFQSLRLENKNSVARDHLANERTFLAWLRTSLTFASIGVALTQLFRLKVNDDNQNNSSFHTLSSALGGLFVCTGILISIFGAARYFSVQHLLLTDKFPASRSIIILSFAITLVLVAVTLGILIHLRPTI